MDENWNVPAQHQEKESAGQVLSSRRADVTLRQNLDDQIARTEKNLEELKAMRERMEKSAILDTRIADIRQAMNW